MLRSVLLLQYGDDDDDVDEYSAFTNIIVITIEANYPMKSCTYSSQFDQQYANNTCLEAAKSIYL